MYVTLLYVLSMLLAAGGLEKQEIWMFNFVLCDINNPQMNQQWKNCELKLHILVLRHDFWLKALWKQICSSRDAQLQRIITYFNFSCILFWQFVQRETWRMTSDPNTPSVGGAAQFCPTKCRLCQYPSLTCHNCITLNSAPLCSAAP